MRTKGFLCKEGALRAAWGFVLLLGSGAPVANPCIEAGLMEGAQVEEWAC